MTGTERKRRWRERNPARAAAAERLRAQARRNGYWGQWVLGQPLRPCASSDSYFRYEHSGKRYLAWLRQRIAHGETRLQELHDLLLASDSMTLEELEALNARLLAELEADCELAPNTLAALIG